VTGPVEKLLDRSGESTRIKKFAIERIDGEKCVERE